MSLIQLNLFAVSVHCMIVEQDLLWVNNVAIIYNHQSLRYHSHRDIWQLRDYALTLPRRF